VPSTGFAVGEPSAGVWALLRRAYDKAGLLVPLSLLVLAGGAYLHHVRPELPSEYTWFQPLNTLEAVSRLGGVPTVIALAWLLGAFARQGARALLADARAAWRTLGAVREDATQRTRWLLRLLVFLALFYADIKFVPTHNALDVWAVALMGVSLTRPHAPAALLRAVLYIACSLLIFTAVCYWFTVVKALVFVGRVPRDADILNFEYALTGIHPHRWLAAWTSERSAFVHWFDWAYCRLFHHMAIVSAFLFGLRDARQRTEYLGALAICYLLGAPLYLLWPAAGPAYFDPSQFAFLRRYPDINVNWMQAVLFQNTAEINDHRPSVLSTWSYIACMPSLHMAHETVMLYYVRASKIAVALSIAFTTLTGFAVVALGWHYPTDIVAGVALAAVAIAIARWQSLRLLPIGAR